MMVTRRAGEDTSVGRRPVLLLGLSIHVAQNDATLRTGEGLMCTARQPGCPFMQWVLELTARDKSEYVSAIIKKRNVLRFAEGGDFGDRFWEEKEALAHDDQLW